MRIYQTRCTRHEKQQYLPCLSTGSVFHDLPADTFPPKQVHLMTDQNPIQVAVDAIVNCGPREDSTRIGSAGTVRRQAVDVSPLRRVNQAISLLTTGAREASFRNVKSIAECLAEELINAAKGSSNSYAIKKKDELERVAKSNR